MINHNFHALFHSRHPHSSSGSIYLSSAPLPIPSTWSPNGLPPIHHWLHSPLWPQNVRKSLGFLQRLEVLARCRTWRIFQEPLFRQQREIVPLQHTGWWRWYVRPSIRWVQLRGNIGICGSGWEWQRPYDRGDSVAMGRIGRRTAQILYERNWRLEILLAHYLCFERNALLLWSRWPAAPNSW